MPSRRAPAVVLALAVLVGTAACTATPTASGPNSSASRKAPALVGLGDSISVGFAACGKPQPCDEASWVTGSSDEVDSIEQRLDDAWGEDVVASNFARPGARVSDLAAQAAQVPVGTDGLVTVLIGANDLCAANVPAMTSPQAFRASLDRALQTVRERAPDAVVLLASLPDIPAILATMQDDPRAQEIWGRGRTCPSVLAAAAGSPAAQGSTAEVEQRVTDLDTQLEQACAAVGNCVFDGGAVSAWRPTIEDLSTVDAFHPSLAGQARLAATLWKAAAGAAPAQPLLGP